jgi:hypothetical protein
LDCGFFADKRGGFGIGHWIHWQQRHTWKLPCWVGYVKYNRNLFIYT